MTAAIEVVSEATPEVLAALHRLVPQLSSSAAPLTSVQLSEILASPAITMFIARDGASICGTLTLVTFRIPSGLRAWIEDVVVDEGTRGMGVGEQLTNAAIIRARELGALSIDLTSRPSRGAANRLYGRMGFVLRETNVYRFSVES